MPLPNLVVFDETDRVDVQGRRLEVHTVTQIKDLVDPHLAAYNPQASCAMNDDHIKADGGTGVLLLPHVVDAQLLRLPLRAR